MAVRPRPEQKKHALVSSPGRPAGRPYVFLLPAPFALFFVPIFFSDIIIFLLVDPVNPVQVFFAALGFINTFPEGEFNQREFFK